ncbi:cysteine rich repeat-containing protein [Hyphomicrobium sp.]|jgi:hypothetical protein|uniref:cysteine rich repeat-containing protein n=1 Tax=Hyphomicrobium sp. TaxID=82 RepID=UPI002B5719CC|nr:cysteine rich repeat-containing protein [Hyphomicrobium sp.]HVZ04979.1 cysteine rich repeat-containing protein [Hyphomicrobium sp.]
MKFYLVAAAFMAAGALNAYAADDRANGAPAHVVGTRHGVCSADIQKFCADVEHGKHKIRDCLSQHLSGLAPECKTRIERHVKKAK